VSEQLRGSRKEHENQTIKRFTSGVSEMTSKQDCDHPEHARITDPHDVVQACEECGAMI